jgi:hypothetical protein
METLIVPSESHEYPSDVVTLLVGKRLFFQKAQYSIEYIYDTEPTRELLIDLKRRGVDLLTFVQRSFLRPGLNYSFTMENEAIALLKCSSFEDWWRHQINKKARNLVRKAEKAGIIVYSPKVDSVFLKRAYEIYNETPIRQGRRYSGYGVSLASVEEKFRNLQNSEVLGAYFNDELVGLLWIVYGDRVARIRSFVSVIKHRDKAPNNALMAESVKRCSEKGVNFIVYEKMGYLPGLDSFKKQNGFQEFNAPRYHVPLSGKGQLAIKLRLHKEIQYLLSPRMGVILLPQYSAISRVIPASIWQLVGA